MPLLALLDQFAADFPGFCKVGKGHNEKIDFDAHGFIAVSKSVHLLQKVTFDAVLVDEAHHPLPKKFPKAKELFQFSATLEEEGIDFQYTMGKAIEDGVLCDYDITVPAVTAHHAYVCLADLLLKQAGRFRRVLAYCNTVAEAKRFQMILEELGLGAWHINAATGWKERKRVMDEFTGSLKKPVHVLVTVEVLGEGVNIPNADTCMFVEPRNSYRSIIQAIGRVLRHHPAKPLGHIVLPALAVPQRGPDHVPVAPTSTELELKQQTNCKEQSLSQKAPISCSVTALPGCPGGQEHKADISLLETLEAEEAVRKRQSTGVRDDSSDANEETVQCAGTMGNGPVRGRELLDVAQKSQTSSKQRQGSVSSKKGRTQHNQGTMTAGSPTGSAVQSQMRPQSQAIGSSSRTNRLPSQVAEMNSGLQNHKTLEGKELETSVMEGNKIGFRRAIGSSLGTSGQTGGRSQEGGRVKSPTAEMNSGLQNHKTLEGKELETSVMEGNKIGFRRAIGSSLGTSGQTGGRSQEGGRVKSPTAEMNSGLQNHKTLEGKELETSVMEGNKIGFRRAIGSSLGTSGQTGGRSQEGGRVKSPTAEMNSGLQNHKTLEGKELETSVTDRNKMGIRYNRRLKLQSLDGVGSSAQEYQSQLDRFLTKLMQADERLIGSSAGHRIQVVDCRIGVAEKVGMDSATNAIYGRLTALLKQTDPWEVRFESLEEFVREHQRFPNKMCMDSSLEVSLSNWWSNQIMKVKFGRLPAHRLQSLQSSSVALIQRRVGKWLAGGPEAIFKQKCQDLRKHMKKHNQLPSRSSPDPETRKLGEWLWSKRRGGARSRLKEINVLKALHPLVEQLFQWDMQPLNIIETLWSRNLEELSTFVSQHGRLPRTYKTSRSESRLYDWLWRQRSRIWTGNLPEKLVAALQDAHPLISEAVAMAESDSLNILN